MKAAEFQWEQGNSGTWYLINQSNGRVAGTVTPLADKNKFKVVDLSRAELIYDGLERAKRAVEASPSLI